MASFGVDFSWTKPSPAEVKAAHATDANGDTHPLSFVIGYISHDSGKSINRDEYEAYLAAGLAVVLVFEDAAGQALGGPGQGSADGLFVRSVVANWQPLVRCVYFAVDENVPADTYPAIDGYGQAFESGLGRHTGPYGPAGLLSFCNPRYPYYWQAGPSSWGGGTLLPFANLYQRVGTLTIGGADCDVDVALTDDFGQTPFAGPTPMPPVPTPAPKPPAPAPPVPADPTEAILNALPTLALNAGMPPAPPNGHVRVMQVLLEGWHMLSGPVDGMFGPGTESSVKQAQLHFGLSPDGVCGPQTWRKLLDV